MTRDRLTPDLLNHFDEVRECDDRLGAYSDHEGNQDGPVAYIWLTGKRNFDSHCDRAIRDHQAAISVWKRLKKMNAKR